MKTPHIVALVVIVACMGVMLFSFSGAVAHHVSIEQAMSRPNETVQVPGSIVKESVKYDAAKGALTFDVAALDPATKNPIPGQLMTIVYAQPKPENFDSAVSVEAIGRYRDGAFHADNLLVKCPSKYDDGKPMKAKLASQGKG